MDQLMNVILTIDKVTGNYLLFFRGVRGSNSSGG